MLMTTPLSYAALVMYLKIDYLEFPIGKELICKYTQQKPIQLKGKACRLTLDKLETDLSSSLFTSTSESSASIFRGIILSSASLFDPVMRHYDDNQ